MKLRTAAICVAGIVAAAILVLGVYLTRYEYFSLALSDGVRIALRTNRWTNETDLLGAGGGRSRKRPKSGTNCTGAGRILCRRWPPWRLYQQESFPIPWPQRI